MKLQYFSSVKNFGDTLNPLIFNTLYPELFKDDDGIDFLGIGSILGLDFALNEAKQKVVFSSGFAYGRQPTIDTSYKIYAVRGPLTAKKLGLDPKLSICDGAILIKYLDFPAVDKTINCSFMPHWESNIKYEWESICQELNINYIDPTTEAIDIINNIRSSHFVIAEAMHMAIIADVFRVPWIPVKCYAGINEFKWNDWTKSLEMEYKPNFIQSLYHNSDFNIQLCKQKISNRIPDSVYSIALKHYDRLNNFGKRKKVIKQFKNLMNSKPYLSEQSVLNSRTEQLIDRMQTIKSDYLGK